MSEEQVSVTTDVVSDNYLLCELRSGLADLRAGHVVPDADVAADLRRRSAEQ